MLFTDVTNGCPLVLEIEGIYGTIMSTEKLSTTYSSAFMIIAIAKSRQQFLVEIRNFNCRFAHLGGNSLDWRGCARRELKYFLKRRRNLLLLLHIATYIHCLLILQRKQERKREFSTAINTNREIVEYLLKIKKKDRFSAKSFKFIHYSSTIKYFYFHKHMSISIGFIKVYENGYPQ